MTTTSTDLESLQWYKVKLSHPHHHGQVVFRSLSERRAKAWLQNRYPRGSEAYLEYPDGRTMAYEHERQGENGTDVELWDSFDPEAWIPPDTQAPPGDSVWADREG